MMRSGWMVTFALLAIAAGSTAGAQDPALPSAAGGVEAVVMPAPPAGPWTAEVAIGRNSYVSDQSIWRPWTSAELLVARRFTSGSIGLGVSEVERFGRRDGAWSVDAYHTLWRGAYGNVRLQVAREAVVLPATDASAELYQGLGSGWEPSLGYRRLGYDEPVSVTSLSLGRYVGERWYGRVRGSVAERGGGGGGGTSASGLLRHYLGSSREFVELSAGGGEEAVTAGLASSGVVVDIRQSWFVETGGRKFVTRHVGGTVSASYVAFEGIPARVGGRVGMVARF